MGLTQNDTTKIVAELAITMSEANEAILKHGGFSTRMMLSNEPTAIDSNATDPRPPATCMAFMRQYCTPDNPLLRSPYIYEWTRKAFHDISPLPAVTQDLARFLLIRGPYSYIGWKWVGCLESYERPPELDRDYGEPVDAVCHESSTGVFERKWSKVAVKMDCNNWAGSITPDYT
jgi:hypothetical protein